MWIWFVQQNVCPKSFWTQFMLSFWRILKKNISNTCKSLHPFKFLVPMVWRKGICPSAQRGLSPVKGFVQSWSWQVRRYLHLQRIWKSGLKSLREEWRCSCTNQADKHRNQGRILQNIRMDVGFRPLKVAALTISPKHYQRNNNPTCCKVLWLWQKANKLMDTIQGNTLWKAYVMIR